MCLVAMRDYQESVTTGQRDRHTDGQTDAGQSDPYVPLRRPHKHCLFFKNSIGLYLKQRC